VKVYLIISDVGSIKQLSSLGAVKLHVAASVYTHRSLFSIVQPTAYTHFTISRRVEGRVG